MAEPLSIVSGIAGIVTLSGAVVAAGYRYINAVASAPKDVRDVVREVAALSALLSQLVAQSLPPSPSSRYVFDTLVRQNVIQDCEVILRSIQKSLQACTPIDEQTRQNALKALAWPLKQKDIAKNGERINRLCAILRTALSIDNTSTLARIENQQTQVVLSVHDSNERQMLAWLSPISPIEKHVAATTLVQPGTCDWIFREQAFNQWMDEGKFLWVHGASGIGKTVLTARITNRLLDSFQTTSKQYAVAYHYCDFANPLTLDPTHILGSLVKQIAEDMDHFPNQLREIYHKLSGKAPQIEELMVLFRQLVSEISRAAYIIIDGVDECLDRKTLLLAVQGLRQPLSGSSAPKVILFSRPEYDIRQALLNEPTFAILPRHIEDSLETHVRIEIAKIPRLRYLTHSGREELTKTLILRADGMFRWVQCQLDVLKTIRTPHALQKALVTLPDGLNETYDRILTQIHASDQVYVIRALRWLTGTHRPLSVEELAEAIAIDPCKTQLDLEERLIDPEEVLDICGSLLRIEATRIVVLAHYSVKEYLLSDHLVSHSKLALFSMVEQISTQHISTCLLTYMFTIQWRIQQLRNEYLDEKEFALIEYAKHAPAKAYLDYEAAKAWFEGYLLSNSYRYEDLATLISYTKPPAPYEGNYPDAWNVQMCIQVSLLFYWNTMIQRDLAEESHRTESRGILEALFITLQREWDDPTNLQDIVTHFRGAELVSPLCTAAFRGFSHVARILLENGAKVNGIPSPYHLGPPLILALKYNHGEIIQVLSDFHADFEVRSPARVITTPLLASLMDGINWKILKKLLEEEKLNWNSVDLLGRSVHYWVKHDTFINRDFKRNAPPIQSSSKLSCEFHDAQVLYETILMLLKSMRGHRSICYHFGRSTLAQCLNSCGPDYLEYFAVFVEQGIARRDPVMLPYHCKACTWTFNGWLRGKTFRCMNCVNTDLCTECHAIWKKSDGKMQMCEGHSFYEIPRPCWYTFEPGIVTEDGKTLPEVIEVLERHFSVLLDEIQGPEKPVPSSS